MSESNVTAVENPDAQYRMSPEMVEVTTSYLQTADIAETALMLGIPKERVSYYLNKPEAKRFVDTIFLEQGYINRHKIQGVLDEIIDLKLEEMRDSEVGSNKDILDILAFAHKIGEDTRKGMRESDKTATVTNQTNVQFNNVGEYGENYTSLMSKLIGK
jgi:hypothetical protein